MLFKYATLSLLVATYVNALPQGTFNTRGSSTLPQYASCQKTSDCADGQCIQNLCLPFLLSNGNHCLYTEQCAQIGICVQNTCIAGHQGFHSQCTYTSQCNPDLTCVQRLCANTSLPAGAVCKEDSQCINGICNGGLCGRPIMSGCSVDGDCQSNNCMGWRCSEPELTS